MKRLLQLYASYNVWAHQKLIDAIQQMNEELWYKETPSSFNSLHKTIIHMWDAESIWWQRMRLHEKFVVPSKTFDPSFKDACNGLVQQSKQWEEFVMSEHLTDEAINSNLIYKNMKGEEFFQPVYEVLHHVFNHGTYHRGQLVTMMRCLGAAAIPQIDFILYSRTVV